MELTLYSLGKGEAKEEKKATIQIGGKETAEQALGISAKKLNLSKLDWKKFDGSGDSKSTAKAEEKKIRKLPSASQCVGSPYSKRALNLSSICRNDRKRNSHHYGNSKRGWPYLGANWNLGKAGSPLTIQRAWVAILNQLQRLPLQRLEWI